MNYVHAANTVNDENISPNFVVGNKVMVMRHGYPGSKLAYVTEDFKHLLFQGCILLGISEKPAAVHIYLSNGDLIDNEDSFRRCRAGDTFVFAVGIKKPHEIISGGPLSGCRPPPEALAENIIGCAYSGNTYERLALALVMLGPDCIEEIVAFLGQERPPDMKFTPRAAYEDVRTQALLVLTNYRSGWTSAQLVNGSTKTTIGGLEVPPARLLQSPKERTIEIIHLCLENTRERLAFILSIMETMEYIGELVCARKKDNLGLTYKMSRRVGRIADDVLLMHEKVGGHVYELMSVFGQQHAL